MERFVEERLRKIHNQRLRNEPVKAIPNKAQGVFLWTRLVVQEIREDLEIGDHSMDVLNRFPAGLQPLFDRAIESIPLRHRQKAYLSFAILIELSEFNSKKLVSDKLVLSDIAYSFLDEYCKSPKFVYTMPVSKWWDVDSKENEDPAARTVMERTKKVPQQIHAWCKGLVETSPYIGQHKTSRMRVVFSNRSIRDYFDGLVIRGKLSAGLAGFSVPDALSHLLLAEFTHNELKYADSAWCFELLGLRQSYSLDGPPFTFLNRWQHLSSQRELFPEVPVLLCHVTTYVVAGRSAIGYAGSEHYNRIEERKTGRKLVLSLCDPLYNCIVRGEYDYPI